MAKKKHSIKLSRYYRLLHPENFTATTIFEWKTKKKKKKVMMMFTSFLVTAVVCCLRKTIWHWYNFIISILYFIEAKRATERRTKNETNKQNSFEFECDISIHFLRLSDDSWSGDNQNFFFTYIRCCSLTCFEQPKHHLKIIRL